MNTLYGVIKKISNYTITTSEAEWNRVFTNEGALWLVTFTLPTAQEWRKTTVVVEDSFGVQINASWGDTINWSSSISSSNVWDIIELWAINNTEWKASIVNQNSNSWWINVWVNFFGDWSDWDVVISVDTSLSADMNYNNLTINPWINLDTNGYRFHVLNNLINNWVIRNNGWNGWNWGNATGWPWWAWGWTGWTATNAWSLWSNGAWWAWWDWWIQAFWNGVNGWDTNNSDNSLGTWWTWGWGWGWNWSHSWGNGWNGWINTPTLTKLVWIIEWTVMRDFTNLNNKYTWSTWGWGWGWWSWAIVTFWWAWWGWGWACGWIVWIAWKNISWTWVIEAKWWNGWNGWDWTWAWVQESSWGGGWAWWPWWVIVLIYNSISWNATNVSWWTLWTWWLWWAWIANWANWSNGLSGVVYQITV